MRVSDMRSVRMRVAKICSHLLVIVLSILICLWMASGAKAASYSLKDVVNRSSESGSVFELIFNTPIPREAINLVFERNFIQIELRDVSAYPAITRRFSESEIVKKAFAYQFQPNLARVRLFLDQNSRSFSSKTTISSNGRSVFLSLDGEDEVANTKVKADRIKARSASMNRESKAQLTKEEKELLAELRKSNAKPVTAKATKSSSIAAKSKEPQASDLDKDVQGNLFTRSQENKGAAVSKSNALEKPSVASGLAKLIFSLLVVLSIIGAIAYAFKKGLFGKSLTPAKPLSNDVMKTLGCHVLGPNRQLMVVKIVDEIVVLGVTENSINHVMNLDPDCDFNFDKRSEGQDFSLGQFGRMIQTKISNKNSEKVKAHTSVSEKVKISGIEVNDSSNNAKDLKSEIKKKVSGFKTLV